MRSDLPRIYEVLGALGNQPECSTCRLCEEHVGLVYLMSAEATRDRRKGLPVLSVDASAHYYPRTRDGWCSCFDPATNTCRVYAERPLCCRLYPLDLVSIEGEVWWVVHRECPIAQRFTRQRQLDVLAAVTRRIEPLLGDEDLADWIRQDRVSAAIEYLDHEEMSLTPLRRFGSPETG
jgi:Fe-S-cluster containining protein